MPRIPQYGAPQVGPVQTTGARFRAADNDGGAAGAIGRGLQQAGGAMSDYAAAQDEIEERLAKANADNLYLAAQSSASTVLADFKTKPGKLALDARHQVDKSLDEAVNSALAQADPRTKKFLEPQLGRLRAVAGTDIATYSIVQAKAYERETGNAKLGNFIEGARSADDPAARAEFIAQIKTQVRANAEIAGLGDADVIAVEERKAVSSVHGSVVDRYLSGEDVEMAKAYFDANEDEMTGNDRNAALAALKSPLLARDTESGVSEVLGIASPAAAQSTNYSDPLRGAGHGISDAYGKARAGGKTHNGVDFPAPAGTPIYSTGSGKVVRAGHDDRSGNFVVIDHGNGMTSSYSHMQAASALKPGDQVTPDTRLGGVGTTGRSSGPHLHMVVKKDGKTVDPTKVIGSAQQSATRYDLDGALAAVDGRDDWSFEKRERVKDGIRARVSIIDGLKARKEADAADAAVMWSIDRGEAFTDMSQMPASIRSNLSPQAFARFAGSAKANGTAAAPKANSREAMRLHAIQQGNPDAFLKADLGEFIGKVTPAELDAAVTDQARMRGPGGDRMLQTRSAVSASIGYQTAFDPAMAELLNVKKNPENYARVARDMEGYIKSITAGKREATAQEIDAAWKRAIMPVAVPNSSRYGHEVETKPRFAAGGRYQVAVPIVTRERIIKEWRDAHNGEMPPDGVIGDIYVQNKGKPEFWE